MYNFIANIISQSIDPHLKLNIAYIFENLISYFSSCTLVFLIKTQLLYFTEICLGLLYKVT